MSTAVTYRVAAIIEAPVVSAFVRAVYAAQVAPRETVDGQATFVAYTDPAAMIARADTHLLWVAERAEELAGVLEIREGTHVALLFVAEDAQRRGIGRGLLSAAFGPSERWPAVTVNSTPGAIGAYARLGFQPVGPEEVRNGLRYQPMRRPAGASL